MNDIASKLEAIAANIAQLTFNPGGSNVTFRFTARRQNHSLVFTHGGIRVKVNEFKLVDADRKLEARGVPYPVIGGNAIRRYFYQGTVDWQVKDKAKGKGDCILGFWHSREEVLRGLETPSAEYSTINHLLHTLDAQLGGLFHTGLLERQPAKEF